MKKSNFSIEEPLIGNSNAKGVEVEWEIQELDIELKYPWVISRESSERKKNFIVKVGDKEHQGRGEVAILARFGENHQLIRDKFKEFKNACDLGLEGVDKIQLLLHELEIPTSLRFGIESAFVDYMARATGESIENIIGARKARGSMTSYSLPIMREDQLEEFLSREGLSRFSTLKVKIHRELSPEYVTKILNLHSGKLRLDANESFQDTSDFVHWYREIPEQHRIEFIEQPFHATYIGENTRLAEEILTPIFADESLLDGRVTNAYVDAFDGVVIKCMKAGGYLKALHQLDQAKRLGLKTMIGCQVESSLGISSALYLISRADYVDLDGCLFIQNDPFGLIHEEAGRIFLNDAH